MADLNYDKLDPGIRKTVRFLRDNHFVTTDSGDGETKQARGYIGEPEPNVYMVVGNDPRDLIEEALRLKKVLVERFGEKVGDRARVEASYSPFDGISIIALHGLSDKDFEQV